MVGLELGRFDGPVDIRLHLRSFGRPERAARLQQTVGKDSFRLHCTPIVNLFKQQAEPIRLTQELHEYPVVADARRPLGLEVYSIDSVRKASRDAQQMTVNEFLPFFSIRHGPRSEEHTSALQSLMRTSYAFFCLQKKKQQQETVQQCKQHKYKTTH